MGIMDEIKARQLAKQQNIATGVASSVDGIDALAAKVERALEKNPDLVEEVVPPVEVPEGAYVSIRLRQFFLSDGSKVEHTNGYFVPKSEEEYQMLEHYVSKGVVEAQLKK